MQCASLIFITSPRHFLALATFHPSKFGAANLPGAPNTCPQTDPNVVFWRGASATGNFEVWHLQHEILLILLLVLMNAHMVIWEIWKMAEYIRIKIYKDLQHQTYGLDRFGPVSSVSSTFRHCQATSKHKFWPWLPRKRVWQDMTGVSACTQARRHTQRVLIFLIRSSVDLCAPCTTLHHLAPNKTPWGSRSRETNFPGCASFTWGFKMFYKF